MNPNYKNLGKVCLTPAGEWSRDKTYERIDIVTHPITNRSYIAKQDVPTGINIDNQNYWQQIGAGGFRDNNIIILSDYDNNDELIIYTLESAINSINYVDRRPGLILGFYGIKYDSNSVNKEWFMYQFNSDTVDDWNDLSCWISIYDNIDKFKGFFLNECLLVNNYIPTIGDYAFVGENMENAVLYVCIENGNWKNTNTSIFGYNEFININYFTKDSGNITEEQYKDIECAIKDHKAIKLLFNNEVVVASGAILNTGLSITFGYPTITGEIVVKQEDYSYIITTRELLINKPGESGQVLTKTTTGYEWKTGSAQGIVIDNSLSIDSTNPVENKVITKAINKINAELFPLTIRAFGGGVYKLGSTIPSATIRWTIKEGDDIVIPDKLTINDDEVDTSLTNETLYNLKSNTTIKISATKNGITVTSTISFIFVNPSYFGAVSNDFVASEELIIALTENIKNTKKYTGTISLNNQKTCYAYPKSFGALTTIKDSNNFEYINSYTRTELNVNNEVYYIYVLTDATTINNFKQIYS